MKRQCQIAIAKLHVLNWVVKVLNYGMPVGNIRDKLGEDLSTAMP